MQKKNMLIKMQKLGNGWENKKMWSAEIGFDRYISLLTGGANNTLPKLHWEYIITDFLMLYRLLIKHLNRNSSTCCEICFFNES